MSLITELQKLLGLSWHAAQHAGMGVGNAYSTGVMRTGLVADRCLTPHSVDNSSRQAMFRRTHTAKVAITGSVQVVFPNTAVQGGNMGFGPGAATSITASVEYPAGTFTQLKFSGATTGNAANNTLIYSDPVTLSIPRNARFWVRVWVSNSVGILYAGSQIAQVNLGDGGVFSATTTADLTMGGTVPFSSGYSYGACAIIGQTSEPSVLILGDSIVKGQGGSVDFLGHNGSIERVIGQEYASLNMGSPGSKAQDFANISASYPAFALFAYCNVAVIGLGTNDVFLGSRTAAQVQTDLGTIAGKTGASRVFAATVLPQTTSTDSWATTANQTVKSQESIRVALNQLLRANSVSGVIGTFDLAAVAETGFNTGLWRAPGMTSDGIHPNEMMYEMIHYSGAINTAAIRA